MTRIPDLCHAGPSLRFGVGGEYAKFAQVPPTSRTGMFPNTFR